MILEVAVLSIRGGQEAEFEEAFRHASRIIASMPGYLTHELRHCLEVHNKYLLLVQWNRLEDHTIGFRGSPEYQEWKRLLHHFYEPFPTVEHFEKIDLVGVQLSAFSSQPDKKT
jgi:heme-degrading monooxygenase HmoA